MAAQQLWSDVGRQAPSAREVVGQLRDLSRLHDAGELTDEEYESNRVRVLLSRVPLTNV